MASVAAWPQVQCFGGKSVKNHRGAHQRVSAAETSKLQEWVSLPLKRSFVSALSTDPRPAHNLLRHVYASVIPILTCVHRDGCRTPHRTLPAVRCPLPTSPLTLCIRTPVAQIKLTGGKVILFPFQGDRQETEDFLPRSPGCHGFCPTLTGDLGPANYPNRYIITR